MPKVSQSHLDARRQQVLAAAIECFSRQGFHPTTMQDIIKESGLSSGAIYTYFASKEELIEAIAERRHARELALIRTAAFAGEITSTLERLIQSFFHSLVDNKERKERRLAIQLWGEALRNPRILRAVRKGVDEPRKMLTKLLQQARDQGELSPEQDPKAMARTMIALFQGLVLQLAWDRSIEVEPLLETVRKMLIDQLLKPSSDSRRVARLPNTADS
jgi:TetR/AcrR family transcriptional regulator, transcriptional repressor of aconitase